MALTVKQKAFADYYIELGNATEAYKRAYTNVTKQRTAESAGNRLLSNVEVKNYIKAAELLGERYRLFVDKVDVNSITKIDSILQQLEEDDNE